MNLRERIEATKRFIEIFGKKTDHGLTTEMANALMSAKNQLAIMEALERRSASIKECFYCGYPFRERCEESPDRKHYKEAE